MEGEGDIVATFGLPKITCHGINTEMLKKCCNDILSVGQGT